MKPDDDYTNRSRLYKVELQFYLTDQEYDKIVYDREKLEKFLIKQINQNVKLDVNML
jgi:hypothetical protein